MRYSIHHLYLSTLVGKIFFEIKARAVFKGQTPTSPAVTESNATPDAYLGTDADGDGVGVEGIGGESEELPLTSSWYLFAQATKGSKLMVPRPVAASQPRAAGKPYRHLLESDPHWMFPSVISLNASVQLSKWLSMNTYAEVATLLEVWWSQQSFLLRCVDSDARRATSSPAGIGRSLPASSRASVRTASAGASPS